MRQLPVFASVFFLLGSLVPAALAHEPVWARFSRDPSAQLEHLARTGLIPIQSRNVGYQVVADASAVLTEVDFERLKRASVAFDRWAEMGMPGVQAMRTVKRFSAQHLLVWLAMNAPGGSSRHYQEVRVFEFTEASRFANTFELAHPSPLYRLPDGRVLPDESAFSRFRGSWYLEQLGVNRVYARYFVEATVVSSFPSIFVGPIAERTMVDGIRDMIQILADQAQLR